MSIIIFLVVLFLLVLVHEFGHFWTAKKTGMRVDEFGIGFPPKLFGIRRGETEYTLNTLPIGGFVKIHGEDLEAVASTDTRSFSKKSKWAQALVLVAGVTANVLFAWFLFVIALSIGTPTAVAPEEAGANAELFVADVIAGSPAEEASLPRGALITGLSVGSEEIAPKTPEAFRTFIETHRGEEVLVHYTYGNDEDKHAELTPRSNVLEGEERMAIGVALGMLETQSLPVHEALYEGLMMTVTGLHDIVVGLSRLIVDAFSLRADLSQVAGPVGIVGLVGDASATGFTTLLMFSAFISLNLAVINLLPFPALDGGRLLFVAIEAIKRSPIQPRFAYYANATGFVILMLLMVAVTFNDILKLT